MSDSKQLYMFAIMPPPELSAKIHNERLNFAEEYKFVKALKPPVHITLFPPFKIPLSDAEGFEKQISKIQDWANHEIRFTIDLNDYGYFDNDYKPVLFINVIANEQLAKLHSGFIKELKKYFTIEKQKNAYKPHITIGYRDVTVEAFPDIKIQYSKKTFKDSFDCKSVFLWKHNGQNWQVLKEYSLNGIKPQLSLF